MTDIPGIDRRLSLSRKHHFGSKRDHSGQGNARFKTSVNRAPRKTTSGEKASVGN